MEEFIQDFEEFVDYFFNYSGTLKSNNEEEYVKIKEEILKEIKLFPLVKNKRRVLKELKETFEEKNKKNLETKLLFNKFLENNNCIILNLGVFYNYEKNNWKENNKLKVLVHESIKRKIPIIIIGEKNPKKFLNQLNAYIKAHFSINNYITPFHYYKKWFDNPKKLPKGKINDIPCSISLEQILEDIIDEYQIEKPYKIVIEENDIKDLN